MLLVQLRPTHIVVASAVILASCTARAPATAGTRDDRAPASRADTDPKGEDASNPEDSATAGRAAPEPNDRTGVTAAVGGSAAEAGRGGNPDPSDIGNPADLPPVELVPPNGEICDRRDNDENGVIDDADVEGDGVCDCLKVASIGRPGAYGQGDLQFRTWPNAMAQNHVVPLDDAELTPERLANIDVLIVLNVSTFADVPGESPHHEFTDAEIAAFERWVRAGGGVFTTAGYSAEISKEVVNVNKLLEPFELAYSPTKYGLSGIVSNWTKHPVTEGVLRVYVDAGAEPDGASAITLAKDAADRVALQAPMSDSARILVWGDEWITYASQWRAEANQQVERFWVNAFTWLSRESSCQRTIVPNR